MCPPPASQFHMNEIREVGHSNNKLVQGLNYQRIERQLLLALDLVVSLHEQEGSLSYVS